MADIDIRRPSTPKPTPKPTSKPTPNPASTHTPKPTLSKMLFDRDMTYSENTSPFLSHFKSQPPASFSPSFSSGPSESYTRLSRSSSNSSLLSSYSATTSTSATSTDDNESGDGFCLVGILKKPRRFRNKSQKRQDLSHGRHQSSSRNHHDANHGNGHHHDDDDDGDDDTEDEQGQQEDDDDEWGECEDDESECEVLFERNVTFAEPLATDIITGTEVSPSSRSRLEWTALRARACLERERAKLEGAWTGREEEQDEEQQEAPRDARGSAAVQRGEEGCGEEEDGCISKRPCEFDLADDQRHWQNDSGLGRGKEGKRRCGVEAEVEHLVREITETVVRQAEQR
ncbi:hypothetical protein SAMD00023353_3600260 [Rosellinia necatrix]|uniref:Uncharacterized protein n=1 Tax=Rosellinia necatrix TaxID=77044 RepID=A0A1W2TN02_ROSNE|nr:hypothetical protein SAMD00023353_3600260 [Rosellinia necatrix]